MKKEGRGAGEGKKGHTVCTMVILSGQGATNGGEGGGGGLLSNDHHLQFYHRIMSPLRANHGCAGGGREGTTLRKVGGGAVKIGRKEGSQEGKRGGGERQEGRKEIRKEGRKEGRLHGNRPLLLPLSLSRSHLMGLRPASLEG
jgi:hypothetical protein